MKTIFLHKMFHHRTFSMKEMGKNIDVSNPAQSITRKNYNKLSKWYDMLSFSERKFQHKGLKILDLKKGERVLEIGFGTGHAAKKMAGMVGMQGEVQGIDISEGMYQIAYERIQKSGYSENVKLWLGNALNVDLPEQYFNAIFMSFTLELFDLDDIEILLGKCKKTLVRDGRIGIVFLTKKDRKNIVLRLYEWLHGKIPQIIDCRPITAEKYLQESGFAIKQSETKSMWGLPVKILLAFSCKQ